jgi:hypothetical protein
MAKLTATVLPTTITTAVTLASPDKDVEAGGEDSCAVEEDDEEARVATITEVTDSANGLAKTMEVQNKLTNNISLEDCCSKYKLWERPLWRLQSHVCLPRVDFRGFFLLGGGGPGGRGG